VAEPLPFDDRDGVTWTNGKLVPWRDARRRGLRHGQPIGNGVFEGEHVDSGTLIKSHGHGVDLPVDAVPPCNCGAPKISLRRGRISAGVDGAVGCTVGCPWKSAAYAAWSRAVHAPPRIGTDAA